MFYLIFIHWFWISDILKPPCYVDLVTNTQILPNIDQTSFIFCFFSLHLFFFFDFLGNRHGMRKYYIHSFSLVGLLVFSVSNHVGFRRTFAACPRLTTNYAAFLFFAPNSLNNYVYLIHMYYNQHNINRKHAGESLLHLLQAQQLFVIFGQADN